MRLISWCHLAGEKLGREKEGGGVEDKRERECVCVPSFSPSRGAGGCPASFEGEGGG